MRCQSRGTTHLCPSHPWHSSTFGTRRSGHPRTLAPWHRVPQGSLYVISRATDGSNTRMRRRRMSTNHSPSAMPTRAGQIGRRSIRRSPATVASASGPGRHAPPVAVAIAWRCSSSGGPNRNSAAGSGNTTRDPTPAVRLSRPRQRYCERQGRIRNQPCLVTAGRDLPQHDVARSVVRGSDLDDGTKEIPVRRRSRPAPRPIQPPISPRHGWARASPPGRRPAAAGVRAPAPPRRRTARSRAT